MEVSSSSSKMLLKCSVCAKSFSGRSALNKHLRNVHNSLDVQTYKVDMYQAKCLDCQCSYRYLADLRTHLVANHEFSNEIINLTFDTFEDFEVWLDNTCIEENVQYIKFRGAKKNENFIVYHCNRSLRGGNLKEGERKRRSKSQGSSKIGSACTSVIRLEAREQRYHVTYYKTHYNHSKDLQHLRIPEKHRVDIANKLNSGLTVEQILEEYRSNVVSDELQRIHLLTRKDVLNIKKSFKIDKKESRTVFDIDSWVKWQRKSEHCGVLYYKNIGTKSAVLQDDDFCLILMNPSQQTLLEKFGSNLIIIESAYRLSDYFEITFLFVFDEFMQLFPAACMLSNHKSPIALELFLISIKKKMGNPISTQILIHDLEGTFALAWKKVMGTPEICYYNSFQVDRKWQEELTKISDIEKRQEIYSTLQQLIMEKDESTLETNLTNFLIQLEQDLEIEDFAKFFTTQFAENYQMWTNNLHFDIQIHRRELQSIHDFIENKYYSNKTLAKLENGVQVIVNFVRRKIEERLEKHSKRSFKISNRRSRNEKQKRDNLDIGKGSENDSDIDTSVTNEEFVVQLDEVENYVLETTNDNFDENDTQNVIVAKLQRIANNLHVLTSPDVIENVDQHLNEILLILDSVLESAEPPNKRQKDEMVSFDEEVYENEMGKLKILSEFFPTRDHDYL